MSRPERTIKALALWRLPRIGPKAFGKLISIDRTFERFFYHQSFSAELYRLFPFLVGRTPDWQGVEQDLRWLEKENHQLLLLDEPQYPRWLQHTEGKPSLLFVKGNVSCLSEPQLAIVGSRQPSHSGVEIAFKMARHICDAGLLITSGLALGVDAAAHKGALAAQKPTIAVLGCGLDQIYPKRHEVLAEQIVTAGGALVSEYPIGVPPLAEHFPRRNRIISGLSLGTLVVEAALKSGSLITANYALQQGREVFAIPGNILSLGSEGCHYLIQQGAKLVTKGQDILEELSWEDQPVDQGGGVALALPLDSAEPLEGEQLAVWQVLESVCTPTDIVVSRTGLSTRTANRVLLELILADVVDAVPGGYIRRSGGMP